MPHPRRHVAPDAVEAELTAGFEAIRAEAGVIEAFPQDAAAEAALAKPDPAVPRVDRRDIGLVAIDPPGSRDLDQALHLARNGSGYRFTYAIADVAAFVSPGGPVDLEARRRGTTIYCPDRRVPLHPVPISEESASLLPDRDTPALLWTIDLDQRGEPTDATVVRAVVRNRAALNYPEVQRAVDAGSADPLLRLLEEVGELRIEREIERGGVSLNLPAQEVEKVGDHYELRFENKARSEDWNAQLSLCCGMAAASLMIDAGAGIVRTLPPPDPTAIDELRRSSTALGVPFLPETSYGQWLRALDVSTPQGVALMELAARTFRGAGYVGFTSTPPPDLTHAAVNAGYAHVTAPIRRLVDRFANECVLAAVEQREPAPWALDALDTLPKVMGETTRVANGVDRECIALTEAITLRHRVGEVFDAMVTGAGRRGATVQVVEPAVVADLDGEAPEVGSWIRARLVDADVTTRSVRFRAEGAPTSDR